MQVLHWLFKVTLALSVSPASDVKRCILFFFLETYSKAWKFQSEPDVLRRQQPQEVKWAAEGKQEVNRAVVLERGLMLQRWKSRSELSEGARRASWSAGRVGITRAWVSCCTRQLNNRFQVNTVGGNQRREGQQTLGLQDQVDRVSISKHTSNFHHHHQKNNHMTASRESQIFIEF